VRSVVRVVIAGLALACPLAAACGSRTGLLVPGTKTEADASLEDSPADAPLDVLDALDAPEDVQDASFPDVPELDICPDAGSTLIYVITQQSDLYSFYPPTLEFRFIGSIACPQTTSEPFSMAVDRQGIGYSVFNDGTLHRIDMASAACQNTAFTPGQDNFVTFGMGFVANTGDAGETLYVAEGNVIDNPPRPNSMGFATIDTTSLALTFVDPFTPPIPGPELTGTGSGQLFGFYTNADGPGSHIVQIDPSSGQLLQNYPLVTGSPDDGYAFAYWGGVFWVFTDPSGGVTTVTRYDPATMNETDVTTMPEGVVGAGVSTCAPQ
jgi:hypothetical protein